MSELIHYQKDFIISNENKFAEIEITAETRIKYYFSGKIIQNDFPVELIELIDEYNAYIDQLSFSLIDPILDKIKMYNLKLNLNAEKIFNPKFSIDKKIIYFFKKYPTSTVF